MSQQCLNNLMVLHVHDDVTDSLEKSCSKIHKESRSQNCLVWSLFVNFVKSSGPNQYFYWHSVVLFSSVEYMTQRNYYEIRIP